MSREAQSIVLLLVGGAVLRISAFSDVYLRYVKEGLRWYLVVAGALLVAVAVVTLWREVFARRALAAYAGRHTGTRRSAADGQAHDGGPHEGEHDGHAHDDDGHGHGGPRVAWLLTLPVFAVFLIAPPPLGSYAASREGATAVLEPSSDFPPLPAGNPVKLTVLDYVTRAIWDKGSSLNGRDVTLSGFVSTGKDGRAYLTRIMLSCCAADGRPLKVALTGDVPDGLAVDTWIEVVGTFDPSVDKDPASQEAVPYLRVAELRRVPAPTQPYEA